jgi:hypothetical protein
MRDQSTRLEKLERQSAGPPRFWLDDGHGTIRNGAGDVLSAEEFHRRHPGAPSFTLDITRPDDLGRPESGDVEEEPCATDCSPR